MLEALPLLRLRFHLQALEPCEVPPYKGDMLRMALLWFLSELWCQQPSRCRQGCEQPHDCLFGQICQPAALPEWPAWARRGDTPPPAYVVWDDQDRRTRLLAGSRWAFELTLAGELALGQVAAVVEAVRRGSDHGMGHVRFKSRIERVEALVPSADGWSAETLASAAHGGDLVWRGVHPEALSFGYDQAHAWAYRSIRPVSHLSLRLLSPLTIRERRQFVEVPELAPLMRNLVRRLRLMAFAHGGVEWTQAEYGPLLDLAEMVAIEHDESFNVLLGRSSKRAGAYEFEGIMGQVWYTGPDLRPLLPLLWLGQWLHLGKGYVLGQGRYEIARID